MPSREQIVAELNYLSETISGKVWTIAVGVLAFCWAFLVNQQGPIDAGALLPAVALALLALFMDMAQYLAGLLYNRRLLRHMEDAGVSQMSYDRHHPFYVVRQAAFVGKIAFCLAAIGWLIAILADFVLARLTGG